MRAYRASEGDPIVASRSKSLRQPDSEWEEIEEALVVRGKRGAARTAASRELDALFDASEQRELQRLAEYSRLAYCPKTETMEYGRLPAWVAFRHCWHFC